MVVSPADLPAIREQLKGKTVVFTCGTFDLMHPGHVDFLEWCQQQGDILVVEVKPDHAVQSKASWRPIQNQTDRVRMVAALRTVDYAVARHSRSADSQITRTSTAELLRPDVLAVGHDWAKTEIDHWISQLPNVKVVVAPPRDPGRSTTSLINTIWDKRAETAA